MKSSKKVHKLARRKTHKVSGKKRRSNFRLIVLVAIFIILPVLIFLAIKSPESLFSFFAQKAEIFVVQQSSCPSGLHLNTKGRCTDPTGHADVTPVTIVKTPTPKPTCNPLTDPSRCQTPYVAPPTKPKKDEPNPPVTVSTPKSEKECTGKGFWVEKEKRCYAPGESVDAGYIVCSPGTGGGYNYVHLFNGKSCDTPKELPRPKSLDECIKNKGFWLNEKCFLPGESVDVGYISCPPGTNGHTIAHLYKGTSCKADAPAVVAPIETTNTPPTTPLTTVISAKDCYDQGMILEGTSCVKAPPPAAIETNTPTQPAANTFDAKKCLDQGMIIQGSTCVAKPVAPVQAPPQPAASIFDAKKCLDQGMMIEGSTCVPKPNPVLDTPAVTSESVFCKLSDKTYCESKNMECIIQNNKPTCSGQTQPEPDTVVITPTPVNPALNPQATGELAKKVAGIVKECQSSQPGIYGDQLKSCFCNHIDGGCTNNAVASKIATQLEEKTANKSNLECVDFVCSVMSGATNSVCSCNASTANGLKPGKCAKGSVSGFNFCSNIKKFKPGDIPIFSGDPGHIGICSTPGNEASPLCDLAEANYTTPDGTCTSGQGCASNNRKIDTTGVDGVWRTGSCN